MTASNIISFRPAPSAGRVGVTGSPRPRAEIPGTMGSEWIDAECLRADAQDAKAQTMQDAARAGETRFGYVLTALNESDDSALERFLIRWNWLILIVGVWALIGVFAWRVML